MLLVSLPQRQHEGTSPVCLYQDREEGDVDQGALLTGGVFRFAQKTYSLPLRGVWQSNSWPEDVRRWFYGFDWLKDLRTFGTNGARLLARSMVASWADRPPADPVARESSVMGRRLANWLGHYEFCLSTATEGTQQLVLDAAVKEARRLSAMLPLPPMGWEGLAVLRGLLAVYMAVPYYDGFFKRFEQQLPLELKRLLGDEGIVAERSPEAQYRCVQELTAIQGMFTTLQHAAGLCPGDAGAGLCRVAGLLPWGWGAGPVQWVAGAWCESRAGSAGAGRAIQGSGLQPEPGRFCPPDSRKGPAAGGCRRTTAAGDGWYGPCRYIVL